jgi:hypothetical protein
MLPIIAEMFGTMAFYRRVLVWLLVAMMFMGSIGYAMTMFSGWYKKQLIARDIINIQEKISQDYAEFLKNNADTIQACYNNHIYDTTPLEEVIGDCLKNAYLLKVPQYETFTTSEQEVFDKYCTLKWDKFSPVVECVFPQ